MEDAGEIAQIRRVIGVGEAVYVAAGARAEVVRALGAPELRAPDRVVMQGEAVVALMPVSSGVTLADAMRAGGPLTAGGCVWVGTRVARALARLHRAGMAHGAVDAECILLESGSAVLLDTGTGVASATQEDDVAALGRLLRDAVRTADVDVMAAWTDPMAATDPTGRPTAAMVARALPGATQERPVAMPGASVATRMRESASRSEGAPAGDGRGKGKPASDRPSTPRTAEAEAAGGPWSAIAARLSTTPRRLAVLTTGAAVALVCLAALGFVASGASGSTAPAASGDVVLERELGHGSGAAALSDPGQAAEALTRRRFEALALADPGALVATTAEGSAARERAEGQAASLAAGDLVYDDLSVQIDGVEVQEVAAERAVVALQYTTSAFVATVDGERTEASEATESVELVMVAEAGRWRVSEVSAG